MGKEKKDKIGFKRLMIWYRDLSLKGKIVLLVYLAGVLPVGAILVISLSEMQGRSKEQQLYALNQGYNQMSQAVEDKMSRIHNISTLLAVNETINLNLTLAGGEISIAQQLANFESINSYTYGMEMAFEYGNILFYIDEAFPVVNNYSGRYRPLALAKEMDWYEILEKNNGRPSWVSFREDIYDTGYSYVAITRKLWDQDDFSKDVGVLAVLMERKALEEMLIGSAQEQIIYLETLQGQILAANVPEKKLMEPLCEDWEKGTGDRNFKEISFHNVNYLVRSQLLDKTNTYLVSMVPQQVMEEQVRKMNMGMGFLYVLVCIAVWVAFVPIIRSVTGRMRLLQNQMMQIQDGIIRKLDMDESQSRADEIGQLITHYNGMVDKVEELMKEQYVLGQEKAGAELKALQSQINPHFLYNTLDMINWMAQKNEIDNIHNIVQAMSRFYKLTLSKGRDIVSIADEVKLCEAYMEIQKRRYRGRICYEAEVEEGIMDCLIPKITLQPFLENAVIHGINEKEDARGEVLLNGWMEDERITLSVTDDGVGMQEKGKETDKGGSHYGMVNIAERLKLFFGEEIPVQVESSPGVGTCVIINIPVRRQQEGEEEG